MNNEEKLQEIAKNRGINTGKTYSKVGSALSNSAGHQSRLQWEKLPLLKDEASRLSDIIKSEDRRVVPVLLSNTRINTYGHLIENIEDPKSYRYRMSNNAFTLLKRKCTSNPEVKNNINSWIHEEGTQARLLTRLNMKHREKTNRELEKSGPEVTRECFAVVAKESSRSYAVAWADKIVKLIAAEFPKDSRCELSYHPQSTGVSLSITLARPFDIDEGTKVGQVYRAGVKVKLFDNAKGAAEFRDFMLRAWCANGMIAPARSNKRSKANHVGYSFMDRIHEMLKGHSDFMNEVSGLLRKANAQKILDKDDGSTLGAQEIFKRLIVLDYVSLENVSESNMLEKLMTAWEYEPINKLSGAIHAITRMAHTNPWESKWAQDELEEQAGNLLYQQNYVLPRLTEQQESLFVRDNPSN